jgi:hypothetical protein
MMKDKDDGARGFGDTIARVINRATGIEPCDNCTKRKEKLNKWFPYTKKEIST